MLNQLAKGNEAMAHQKKKENCKEKSTSLLLFLPDWGFMSLNGDSVEENEDRR